MVHRACKLARACVPAVEPVAFTTDVRCVRTSQVNSQTMTTNMKSIIQAHFLSDL